MDRIWTFLDEDYTGWDNKDGFWGLVANLDYSWFWSGKNMFGFIEYY